MQWQFHVPGFSTTLIIAVISFFLGQRVPLVGSAIFALLIGIGCNLVIADKTKLAKGLNFCSKTVLKTAIVLLGTGLSVMQIVTVGRYSLYVMMFTLASAFGMGYLFGRLLGINWKMSSLISAGTGICGGSAIAAVSPVIGADDSDVTYAIAATFVFDMLMIVLFPLMGQALGLSDLAFGLWAGTAVNDTSSVVAAGYAYSDLAGEYATIVKLTRTLSIIPTVLIFALIGSYRQQKQETQRASGMDKWQHLKNITPWFILLFVGLALVNSMGFIPSAVSDVLKIASKFLMTMALGAIGLKTDLKKMVSAGVNPMILGLTVSTIVVIVSISVQTFLGQL